MGLYVFVSGRALRMYNVGLVMLFVRPSRGECVGKVSNTISAGVHIHSYIEQLWTRTIRSTLAPLSFLPAPRTQEYGGAKPQSPLFTALTSLRRVHIGQSSRCLGLRRSSGTTPSKPIRRRSITGGCMSFHVQYAYFLNHLEE
jgi:hypothetical protein